MLLYVQVTLMILLIIFHNNACQVTCTTDADCFPQLGLNISQVRCESSIQICNCTECLEKTNDGLCVLNPCFTIVNSTCLPLNRRSKTVTIVLAIFFTSLGAANFYISQWVLGGLQLAISLFTWGPVIFFTAWDLGLFTIFEKNIIKCQLKTRQGAIICSFTCSIIFLVLVILLGVTIVIWWFVDVITFSTDGRTDGRGCSLV